MLYCEIQAFKALSLGTVARCKTKFECIGFCYYTVASKSVYNTEIHHLLTPIMVLPEV